MHSSTMHSPLSKTIAFLIFFYHSSPSCALSMSTVVSNRKVAKMSSLKRSRNAILTARKTSPSLAKLILQKRKQHYSQYSPAAEELSAVDQSSRGDSDVLSWIECLFDEECILYNKDHFNIAVGLNEASSSSNDVVGNSHQSTNRRKKSGLFGSPTLYRNDHDPNFISPATEEMVKPIKEVGNRKESYVTDDNKTPKMAKKRIIENNPKSLTTVKTKLESTPRNTIKISNTVTSRKKVSTSSSTVAKKGLSRASKFKASRSRTPIRNKTELSLMKCLFGDSKKAENKQSTSGNSEIGTNNKKRNMERMLQKQAISKRKELVEDINEEKLIIKNQNKKPLSKKLPIEKSKNLRQKTVLLTKEEEIELASLIQQGIKLQQIKSNFENIHNQKITHEKWAQIAKLDATAILEEQLDSHSNAKNKLITSNLGLVYSTIKNGNYARNGVSEEELVQEGCLGLIRAAELFDPTKGYRFSTYATIWIKGTLGNSRIHQIIAIPDREKRKWNKIQKAVQQMSPQQHISMDYISKIENSQEIAEMVDMSMEDVQRIARQMNNMKQILSLDYKYTTSTRSGATTTSNSDFSLEHKRTSSSPEDLTNVHQIYHLRHDVLVALSKTLSSREEQILRLRYGLTDDLKSRSIVECAQEMGLSRARVQQLAAASLKKLREQEDVALLQEYLVQI